MKRLLALLICFALCAALVPAASAENSLVLTAEAADGCVTLTLSATEDLVDCCGMLVCFTAPEGFTYVDKSVAVHTGFGNLTSNGEALKFVMDNSNRSFLLAAGEPIISFRMTIPEGLEPGRYPFTASMKEAYDWYYDDYSICGQTVEAIYTVPFPPPAITAQPQSVAAAPGETVSFSVGCDQPFAAFRWYYKSSAGAEWKACSGTGSDTDTLRVEAKTYRNGYQYRCEVTGRSGSVISEAATLTVQAAPAITAQPQPAAAAPGESVAFRVGAEGFPLSYQWYYRTSPNGAWNKSSGGTGATLTVEAKSYRNGYQYRCEVSNSLGSVSSEPATLTVLSAPAITAQPQSVSAAAGESVSFSVGASGGNLSYQWYYRTSPNGAWNKSSGGSGATLTVEAKSYRSGYQYRCEVSNSLGSAFSEPATLTVSALPVITAQPQSAVAATGETVNFRVTASGEGLSYQWQYRTSASGEWKNSSGSAALTASFPVEAKSYRSGYQYRCVVTNASGSVSSEAATLTVLSAPTITAQPRSAEAAVGASVSFSVSASGGNLSYQWYYRTSASGAWNKCSGGTAATLTVEAKSYRSGYQYRCQVSNSQGSLYSEPATLTVR